MARCDSHDGNSQRVKSEKKLLFAPEGGEKEENNSLRFTPFILVGFYQIFSVECVPYGK